MNRRPVTSTNVASIGWDDETLEVEFTSGHIYLYHDVPESEYQALLGASSIGKHLASIRDKYQSTRLK
jgi:KTSC domain-containing protein